MSVFRPARCLLYGSSIPKWRPRVRCQNLHISHNLCERQGPRLPGTRASEKELLESEEIGMDEDEAEDADFKPYTSEEMEALKKRYTPGQIEAIKAGEAAIDPEDLEKRGVIRTDIGSLSYFDDLSKLQPVVDRKQRYEGPIDPNWRLTTDEENWDLWKKEYDKAFAEVPLPEPTTEEEREEQLRKRDSLGDGVAWMKADDRVPFYMGSNGPIPRDHSTDYTAPGLPRSFMDDEPKKVKKPEEEEADPRDPEGLYNKLIKQTGLTLDQIFEYKVKILVQHRVVNQTRLGKIASIYCLAIAGNGNGRLGIGEAKGQETEETTSNARIAAIRSMQPIPRYEERTIFGEVEGKVSAAEVKLMSRPPGFGLRCQHLIFEMARAAGIHDLAAKVPRSRNKMNTVKATYQALMKQRIPDEIARGRGKKLVDVRKVYYAGRV